MKRKFIGVVVFIVLCTASQSFGQGYSKPTRMVVGSTTANLSQDVALLKEQLGEMRFEVERLLRENEALTKRLNKVETQSASSVSDAVFRLELASLRSEFNRLNKSQKEELLEQISKQIRVLAKETEKSLQSAVAGGSADGTPIVTKFNDDYPKSGIFYVVKSGDNLSSIASGAGSTITYIIHANKIADPDRLQVGEELFIPIDNP